MRKAKSYLSGCVKSMINFVRGLVLSLFTLRGVSSKKLLVKWVCAILMINLLTLSAPAAPVVVAGKVSEIRQDIRFAYISGGFSLKFPNWLFGLFSTTRNSSQTGTVNRIQIYPGSVQIKQGTEVVLSAVAYDSLNKPVSGLAFDWQVIDAENKTSRRFFKDNLFSGTAAGTFIVSAETGGARGEVTVTVTPATPEELAQTDSNKAKKSTLVEISSRSLKTTPEEKSQEKTENTDESNLLPEDGGWNDGNSGSSGLPGNQTGNPPGTPADGGAGNGNFQLSAPVVSLPGRGINLALNLNYNSRLWNKSDSELTYDIDRGFPAPGWNLGFGKLAYMGAASGCMLVDADGTRHGYSGYPDSAATWASFYGHTSDGTFIDYGCNVNYGTSSTGWAKFPNGTKITYSSVGPANDHIYPTKITDVQGNYITITYRNNQGPAIETITDTLGRVISFNYDSNDRLISVTAPGMVGEDPNNEGAYTRTLIQLHYRSLTLGYSFGSGITPVVRNSTVQVIDSIYYPGTNTGYWFGGADSNHPDYAGYYSSYGMLTKVEEQRGMSWQTGTEAQGIINSGQMSKRALYNYPLTTANETNRTNGIGLTDAPTYTTLTESWAERDVNEDAVTTYAFNNNVYHHDGTSNSPAREVVITQPNGVINKQYSYRTSNWTNGLVFADETLVMNGSTPTVVSSSIVSWEPGEYSSARPNWAKVFDENGQMLKTDYIYTGGRFNQITKSCDYDNSNTLLQCAVAEYENHANYIGNFNQQGYYFSGSGNHLFNLLKASGIENPDGTKASWTTYEYDNYQSQALADTPGVVQHEQSFNPYNTGTYTVCRMVCPSSCPDLFGENPEEQQRCRCMEELVCEDYPIFNSATNYRGNITKVTNYSNAAALPNPTGAIEETRGYDITGNLIKASSSCCEQTTIEYGGQYETQYAYPKSQTIGSSNPNSSDRITTYTVHNSDTGLIKQSTDSNGRTTATNYDPYSLRPIQVILSTGAQTILGYNDLAMTITEEVIESNNVLAGKTIKYLNGLGLVKKNEILDSSNNILNTNEVKYNKYGEEWKTSRPYKPTETPQWREKFYDLQGRVKEIKEPDNSSAKSFYNETQKPVGASVSPGNTMRVVDAWGRERWGRYDQRGRLAEVFEPNPDRTANPTGSVLTAGGLQTKYFYDTPGRLIKTEQLDLTVPNTPITQIREFKYDSVGRLTRQKLAEQTATLDDIDGKYVGPGSSAKWSESFFYDNRSNLIQKIDARGVRTNYEFQQNGNADPLNRLQVVWYDLSGNRDTTYPIHDAPPVVYGYMTSGDKTRIQQIRTVGLLTEDFDYFSDGKLKDYTQTVDYRTSYPMKTSYAYDSLNRTIGVQYPKQYGLTNDPRKLVETTFNSASRLSSLKVGGQEVAGNIQYTASDQISSIKVGPSGKNQVTESYTYDSVTGLMTGQKATKDETDIIDLSYQYDRNGSVGSQSGKTGHLSKIIDNLNNNKNRTYEYDALGRLTKAEGGTNSLWTQNYGYDRFGNRKTVSSSGVAADNSAIPTDGIPVVAYDRNTNRITNSGFEYDHAGNQTRALAPDGVTWLKYEYDAANRIRVVRKDDGNDTAVQGFQYGSTNARLMDWDYQSGRWKIYASIGGTTLAEYDELTHTVPTWIKSYTYMGDTALSTETPNGSGGQVTEYNHPDRLGTKTVTNQALGTSYEQNSLPYGTALAAESTTSLSRRFTSYERSNITGLDYAINRTYDSKQGRFTQVDPIGMSSVSFFAPQTLNLYSYCGNDPINHTDPSGLFWGKLFKWLGKILKIIILAVSIALAVLTIAAPGLFFLSAAAKLLGIIGSIANIAATVSEALGFTTASKIFGIIEAITSFGSSFLVKETGRLIAKWTPKAIWGVVKSSANLASKILSAAGFTKASQFLGFVTDFAGYFGEKNPSWWKAAKLFRSTAERVATLSGNKLAAKVLGLIGAGIALYEGIKGLYDGLKALFQPLGSPAKISHYGELAIVFDGKTGLPSINWNFYLDENGGFDLGRFVDYSRMDRLRDGLNRAKTILDNVNKINGALSKIVTVR